MPADFLIVHPHIIFSYTLKKEIDYIEVKFNFLSCRSPNIAILF